MRLFAVVVPAVVTTTQPETTTGLCCIHVHFCYRPLLLYRTQKSYYTTSHLLQATVPRYLPVIFVYMFALCMNCSFIRSKYKFTKIMDSAIHSQSKKVSSKSSACFKRWKFSEKLSLLDASRPTAQYYTLPQHTKVDVKKVRADVGPLRGTCLRLPKRQICRIWQRFDGHCLTLSLL